MSVSVANKRLLKNDIITEKMLLSTDGISDERIKDNGIVYTPVLIVNQLHDLLSETIENWKEYTIWDCSCGRAALTKSIEFPNLFLSTLEKSDISLIKKLKFNENSTKFQFDFLNESFDKLPNKLKTSLMANKKILFIINPPYNSIESSISLQMKNEDYSPYTYKLGYVQFIYKIIQLKTELNLTNVKLACITPLAFLTKETFSKFRFLLNLKAKFLNGIIFNSNEFEIPNGNWTAGISIFDISLNSSENVYTYKRMDNNEYKTFHPIKYSEKFTSYLNPKEENTLKISTLKLKNHNTPVAKIELEIPENLWGYYVSTANDINSNNFIQIMSYPPNMPFLRITDKNILDVVVNFTARKAIPKRWHNSYDQYYYPNMKNGYYEFSINCLVYSLFNNSSQQSAFRNFNFLGEKYSTHNEFFFMSPKEIYELAMQNNNISVLQDLELNYKYSKTYLILMQSEIDLYDSTKLLLNHIKNLIIKTFPHRTNHPKLNLHCWDAGWQQIIPIVKEYFKDDYKTYLKLYSNMEKDLVAKIYYFEIIK